MIWVLVCINMYRYERNFRLFLPPSNNSEMVSILSKMVNTDLMDDRRFYWNTTPGKNFTPDASVVALWRR